MPLLSGACTRAQPWRNHRRSLADGATQNTHLRRADSSRAFYDLKPLCGNQEYYNYTDAAFPASGLSLVFQICGLANTVCVPPYKVAFNRATAIQFIDNGNKGLMCNDTNGVSVPCTGNCEILGEGPPTIGLLDANNAYGGVQVTYFGVPSVGNDNVRDGTHHTGGGGACVCWQPRVRARSGRIGRSPPLHRLRLAP